MARSNSKAILFQNVVDSKVEEVAAFKNLKNGTQRITVSRHIIKKAHLKKIIEDPKNATFDSFELIPILENNKVVFFIMPHADGDGPGPGQGVKVPA